MIFFDNFHSKYKILRYNYTRFRQHQRKGHYESYFIRANHPSKPLGFWIRYTIFNPNKNPKKAIGELWAVLFNGDTNQHAIAKIEVPISECSFSRNSFEIKIASSILNNTEAIGEAKTNQSSIKWKLDYEGNEEPLYLFPSIFYDLPLPKAKALVGLPFAKFNGEIEVNGSICKIANWVGSQNHNWGSEHTDRYAWGQVAGFDNYPDSFLEIATAQIKVGWAHTPKLTILVLRHKGKEVLFNNLKQSVKNKGSYSYFSWKFSAKNGKEKLEGTIEAEKEDIVGLNYYNPPGGEKYCLNTKIASASIIFTDKNGIEEELNTQKRAAFEILTNDKSHGVEIFQPGQNES